MENKWILKYDDKETEYTNFDEARKEFRRLIINSINNECFYAGVPFSLGAYFSGKYNSNSISDGEIVIESRTTMLLNTLCYENYEDAKNCALDVINKDYFYEDEDEFYNLFKISIKKSDNYIQVYIKDDNTGDYLFTNAFNLDNRYGKYVFHYKELISTKSNLGDLGDTIYSDIELKSVYYDLYKEKMNKILQDIDLLRINENI